MVKRIAGGRQRSFPLPDVVEKPPEWATATVWPTVKLSPTRLAELERIVRSRGRQAVAIMERMAVGRATLDRDDVPPEARQEAEETWRALSVNLFEVLHEAYGGCAVIRDMPAFAEYGAALWREAMPPDELVARLDMAEVMRYWADRTDPPHWYTEEEGRLMVKHYWPPTQSAIGAVEGAFSNLPY